MASTERSTEELERIAQQRARRAFIALAVFIVLIGLQLLATLVELFILYTISKPKAVSDALITITDVVIRGFGVLHLLLFVVTAVLWLMWMHAAYKNLDRRTDGRVRDSPAWAVGSWFIPLANLVVPYRITKELWRVSQDPDLEALAPPKTTTVSLWWTLWILGNIASSAYARMPTETLDEMIRFTYAGMVADVAFILAGLLALVVLRNIARWQRTWGSRSVHEPPQLPEDHSPASYEIDDGEPEAAV